MEEKRIKKVKAEKVKAEKVKAEKVNVKIKVKDLGYNLEIWVYVRKGSKNLFFHL